MTQKIQFKRGNKSGLPILNVGEPALTTDTNQVFIGNGTTNIEMAKQSDLNVANINITNLTSKIEASAEIIRDSIPSGFQKLGNINYTYMSTNPNTIKMYGDSVAYVYGYKVTIPDGTIINLNAPPTSGTRDDLVFLECWKQDDGTGVISWNSRIRVVDGVDFSVYPEGMSGYNTSVLGQGGANTPVTNKSFNKYSDSSRQFAKDDAGMYIAGNGSSVDKTNLNTTDGYVYAIPMLRIHRRNSGGYSVSNGNGSILYKSVKITAENATTQGDTTLKVSDTSVFKVGEIWGLSNVDFNRRNVIIKQIIDSTTLSVTVNYCDTSKLCWSGDTMKLLTFSDIPPNSLFTDIIYARDIIDLRHQVSLTGFNYQQLLEENFDKLMSNELQTSAKTSMLKTYHGIPKTPIDSNTIFYASFDGTTVAEKGTITSTIGTFNKGFSQHATGLGLSTDGFIINTGISSGAITIDTWIKKSHLTGQWQFGLIDADIFMDAYSTYASSMYLRNNTGGGVGGNIDITQEYTHIRFRAVPNDKVYFYINGRLANSRTIGSISNYKVTFKNFSASKITISDLSISNIDRGLTFATLSQDFIDSYARISPSFNEQRNTFSDTLTSETITNSIKASGETKKQFTITQATSGTWANGDKISIKGLTGEIITGVIDSDTALAIIINDVYIDYTHRQLTLNDVSKIAVGDTFIPYTSSGANNGSSYIFTVDSISGNVVTVNSGYYNFGNTTSYYSGGCLYETTANSSSPIAKYYNGTALVDVTGTWSGLGTNEVVFTLGTNANLTNQELIITYSLNEVAGQGGISEVLTTTLGGESNGKKLTVNPSIHIRDDFAGKVASSMVECPNIMKWVGSAMTSLVSPYDTNTSKLGECSNNAYSQVSSLDNTCLMQSQSNNGVIPQVLFCFNLIRIVEDKFGALPCGSDVASKVAWLKNNINWTFNWYGYGTCSNGNKASYLKAWVASTNSWTGTSSSYNTSSSPTRLYDTCTVSSGWVAKNIDANGFIYFLAYTDASNGTTPSTIYTDYCNIELTLNTPIGYDVLSPENPRRDDGKSSILFVRKETKEIQTLFSKNNSDKIVTYGDYVPKQGLLPTKINLTDGYSLVNPKAFLTTLSTKSQSMIFNSKTNFGFLDEYLAIDNTINSSLTDGSQLFSDDGSECSMLINSNIRGYHKSNKGVSIGNIAYCTTNNLQIGGDKDSGCSIIKYIDSSIIDNSNSQYVSLLVFLVKSVNGALYLLISAYGKSASGKSTLHKLDAGNGRILGFLLSNNQLIK